MKTLIYTITFLAFTSILFSQEHEEYIEGPFKTPQEVTAACLDCHDDVTNGIMKTQHWNWHSTEFFQVNGDSIRIGKQNMINNFCIAVPSNWPRCTSCHIGYGWEDESFDFTDEQNIDCLICHDQTGTYSKTPTGAGMPDKTIDLVVVAQSVGLSTRQNCGICHFYGGGGNEVKHGDLDNSLLEPSEELDFHMGGLDFECTECHRTEDHNILGAGNSSIATNSNHISCTDCHEDDVHEKESLNRHVKSVACETCHIPLFAREEPTKIWWDWSTAGKNKESEIDTFGMPLYHKKKGDFKYGKNIIPEYRWFNGSANYYISGDKLDPSQVLKLNPLNGDILDLTAKIYPFKVMRGKQIYDKKNNYLIIPNLYSKKGYWKTFDWDCAAKKGMDIVGLDYSGSYGFVETEMNWPIHHMVVPAENALKCTSCHGKKRGNRMNWSALGYKKDPNVKGGRFKNIISE
jgi:octaheme c-type cytochrome (tetrathionate reductase family)